MAHPQISIVMPSFNCAHFLPRAINSVLNQSYPNWELIIVDNHSSDNTLEVVQTFQDSRIKLLQIHNEGIIARSRNLGINKAVGRWVAFLDADDWWTVDKLQASVDALKLGYDVVYHDLVRMGPGKRLINGRFVRTRQLLSPCYQDLLIQGNVLANSSVVVSRALLLDIGVLSENPLLVAVEDYDCWLRLARKTEKFICLQRPHGFYWIGQNNVNLNTKALGYLNELQRLYFSERDYVDSPGLPLWLSLALVKAYIRENSYEKARGILLKISLHGVGYHFLLRIAALKLVLYFKHSCRILDIC